MRFVVDAQLPPALRGDSLTSAKAEGVAVNQLINVAVAEKVSALRTEEHFAERARQGDVRKALSILERAGVGQAPVEGDELPSEAGRKRRRRPKGGLMVRKELIKQFGVRSLALLVRSPAMRPGPIATWMCW